MAWARTVANLFWLWTVLGTIWAWFFPGHFTWALKQIEGTPFGIASIGLGIIMAYYLRKKWFAGGRLPINFNH